MKSLLIICVLAGLILYALPLLFYFQPLAPLGLPFQAACGLDYRLVARQLAWRLRERAA